MPGLAIVSEPNWMSSLAAWRNSPFVVGVVVSGLPAARRLAVIAALPLTVTLLPRITAATLPSPRASSMARASVPPLRVIALGARGAAQRAAAGHGRRGQVAAAGRRAVDLQVPALTKMPPLKVLATLPARVPSVPLATPPMISVPLPNLVKAVGEPLSAINELIARLPRC